MGFDATGGKPYKANQDGPLWYGIIGLIVIICFVAVFLGPKLFGKKTPLSEMTIAELVSGRDIPQAAGLINAYGFQDELTKSVLIKMQQIDAEAHAVLLTDMAKKAQAGVSKNDLSMMLVNESKSLISRHEETLFKSEVSYFDQIINLLTELSLEQQAVGESACDLASLYRISQNSDLSSKYMHYGSTHYQFSMRAILLLLGAVESGALAPQSYGELTSLDSQDLSPLIVQMAATPEVLQFLEYLALPKSQPENLEESPPVAVYDEAYFDDINGCEQIDTLLAGVQALPAETRARFWASKLVDTTS